jgi:hypothetical protein
MYYCVLQCAVMLCLAIRKAVQPLEEEASVEFSRIYIELLREAILRRGLLFKIHYYMLQQTHYCSLL